MTDAIEAGAMAIKSMPLSIGGYGAFIPEEVSERMAKACIEAAIASGALVPASATLFTEEIAALAHRFWSIHPSEIAAKNLTREEFYAREMTNLVQKATTSAVVEMRERCAQAAEGPLYLDKYRGEPGHNWWHEKEPGDYNRYGNGRHDAAADIRQLDLAPASGDYVVVPREAGL